MIQSSIPHLGVGRTVIDLVKVSVPGSRNVAWPFFVHFFQSKILSECSIFIASVLSSKLTLTYW